MGWRSCHLQKLLAHDARRGFELGMSPQAAGDGQKGTTLN